MKKTFLKSFSFCFISLFFLQCAGTPPVYIYNQASLALKKAREAYGKTYSPKTLKISQRYYNQGEKLYTERRYRKAKEEFLKAIKWAEKTENLSLIRKIKEQEEITEEERKSAQ